MARNRRLALGCNEIHSSYADRLSVHSSGGVRISVPVGIMVLVSLRAFGLIGPVSTQIPVTVLR